MKDLVFLQLVLVLMLWKASEPSVFLPNIRKLKLLLKKTFTKVLRQRRFHVFSMSGWSSTHHAQKADFALSQGIHITQVLSWIGIHSQPCASDVHDAVVVMGCMKSVPRLSPDPQVATQLPPSDGSHLVGRTGSSCDKLPQASRTQKVDQVV